MKCYSMTDNKIINQWKHERELAECVCSYFVDQVELSLVNETIDLINRQKAEIDSLKKEIQITKDAYNMLQTKNEIAKSEAVKEFASRLKYGVPQEYGVISCYDVDKLVKEMVGKEE